MDTLMKADVFFVITSVAVVIFTIFFIIIATHIVRFFGSVNRIIRTIEDKAGDVTKEAKEALVDIRESFLFRLFFPHKTRKKKQK
jgi:ABC-type multidrug transport system fused ATPase/permease subunit